MGINRIVVHTSVHQPLVGKAPGLSLGPYGQYDQPATKPGRKKPHPGSLYLRGQDFLLQQGHFAADVAHCHGEEAPLTALMETGKLADTPTQYGYDFVNSDALLRLFRIENGMFATPSGMHYRVLYLGGASQHMTLAVLRKLHDLVEAGEVKVGQGADPILPARAG